MKITRRRIEATVDTLIDLTILEHDALDGATRDAISKVIAVLEDIGEAL